MVKLDLQIGRPGHYPGKQATFVFLSMIKIKIVQQINTSCSERDVTCVLNPSRTLLNLVFVSHKVREM